ncbi:MAG: hypothetical protein OEM02_13060 [Desulfobulbaceae bacterium]|nr:hypothetical protein [Desulfobulbaceae bacterium]
MVKVKIILLFFCSVFVLSIFFGEVTSYADKKYKVVWSHHPAWEAWSYIGQQNVMDDWEQRFKTGEILSEKVDNYLESLRMFMDGRADACVMYLMDALTIPALQGVESTVLVIVGFSKGAEGIVFSERQDISALNGRFVRVERFSPSHYLISRAIEENGLDREKVSLVNTREEDIPKLFGLEATNKRRGVASVGGEFLMQTQQIDGARLIYNSAMLPGEIVTVLVVRSETADNVKRALAGAWFEVMQVMADKDDPERANVISHMASSSGMELTKFKAALKKHKTFYLAREAAAFAKSYKMKSTVNHIHNFAAHEGLYEEAGRDGGDFGVLFSDGGVVGSIDNIMLRIEKRYMLMASDWLN